MAWVYSQLLHFLPSDAPPVYFAHLMGPARAAPISPNRHLSVWTGAARKISFAASLKPEHRRRRPTRLPFAPASRCPARVKWFSPIRRSSVMAWWPPVGFGADDDYGPTIEHQRRRATRAATTNWTTTRSRWSNGWAVGRAQWVTTVCGIGAGDAGRRVCTVERLR